MIVKDANFQKKLASLLRLLNVEVIVGCLFHIFMFKDFTQIFFILARYLFIFRGGSSNNDRAFFSDNAMFNSSSLFGRHTNFVFYGGFCGQ